MAKAKVVRNEDPYFVCNMRVMNPWIRWSRCGDGDSWLSAKLSLMKCDLLLEAFEVEKMPDGVWMLKSDESPVLSAFERWRSACQRGNMAPATISGKSYYVFASPLR